MKNAILGLLTLTILIFSCKKDDNLPTTKTYPIEGLWIGTYTTDGQPSQGQQYFSFVVKPDKTIITETIFSNQQQLALGMWLLTGSNLTSSFTYIHGSGVGTEQSTSATWDKSGKLNGTFRNVSPANGVTGTFTLTRVN